MKILLNYSVRDMVVQISLHNTYISSIALPWLWPSRYPTQLQSLALRMYYNRGCKVAGARLKYGDLLYQPILGGQQHCRLLNAPVWYSNSQINKNFNEWDIVTSLLEVTVDAPKGHQKYSGKAFKLKARDFTQPIRSMHLPFFFSGFTDSNNTRNKNHVHE